MPLTVMESARPHQSCRKGFSLNTHRVCAKYMATRSVYGGMEEAVQIAAQMAELFKKLDGRIDERRFQYTLDKLVAFVSDAQKDRDSMAEAFEEHTGTKREDALSRLTASALAAVGTYNVRHFGAVGDGTVNDAPAINKAINACNKAGGGTVFVPSGFYTTGSIHPSIRALY
jgi:polygalacturonase